MLTLITDQQEVNKLYSELRALLESNMVFPVHLPDFHIGHQGGAAAIEARYSSQLDFWTSPSHLHWNAFGVGKTPSMVVQINFQDYTQQPRRVGAAFALDEANHPVVIHRGHIGGGRAGVGLTLMRDHCRAQRAWLREDQDQETDCFVVGQLRSKFFARQLANFVWEVHRVKSLESGSISSSSTVFRLPNTESIFRAERTGTTTRSQVEQVELTHGLVVNELAKRLAKPASSRGWQVQNDRHRDLMLLDGHELKVLFEVKTGVTTQNICTGLGQLLLYSTAHPAATLVLVVPEKLSADLTAHLSRWNIHVLPYRWVDTTPRFRNLELLLGK